jgi:hypothetical protein
MIRSGRRAPSGATSFAEIGGAAEGPYRLDVATAGLHQAQDFQEIGGRDVVG